MTTTDVADAVDAVDESTEKETRQREQIDLKSQMRLFVELKKTHNRPPTRREFFQGLIAKGLSNGESGNYSSKCNSFINQIEKQFGKDKIPSFTDLPKGVRSVSYADDDEALSLLDEM